MAISLQCDVCGTNFEPDDVDLTTMAAMCRSCMHVVDLEAGLRGSQRSYNTTPEQQIAAEQPPAGIDVASEPGRLVLRRRWYHRSVWPLVAFSIFWNSFMVLWYVSAIAAVTSGEGGAVWLALVFPIPHVAVGVFLTWSVAANFLNTTTINVSRGMITVTHGPLWWREPNPIQTRDLDQFFVTKPDQPKSVRGQTWKFEVHAVERDRTAQRLLTALPDYETARYIERRLESYLEVVDRPIRDEIPR